MKISRAVYSTRPQRTIFAWDIKAQGEGEPYTMIGNFVRLALLMIVWTGSTTALAQRVVAHRGASHDAPENTLAAFKLAWQQGSDGIEGDFYLTADRRIVCIHDKTTERTTGVDWRVERSTFDRLRTLDAGSWKSPRWSGERIPSFAEVFATVPEGKLFVIELKSRSPIVPVLANELKQLDTEKISMLIISFDAETIRLCKQLLPDIRAHWLTSFRRDSSGRLEPSADRIAATVRQCQADGVGMNGKTDVIDQAFVTRLGAAGCDQYHVWTVDDPDQARYFQELGVCGITTNRPDEIAAAIRPSSIAP